MDNIECNTNIQKRGNIVTLGRRVKVLSLPIMKIDSHGPLEATGVQREWLITHVNGEKVRFKKDFLALVRQGAPGQQLNLSLLIPDSGRSTEKTLKLEYFQQRR